MPSYEEYMRQGYGHALSEQLAQSDEEEAERDSSADQREAAWRKSLPRLAPDRVFRVDDSEVSVYVDGNAGEMRRREGGRR